MHGATQIRYEKVVTGKMRGAMQIGYEKVVTRDMHGAAQIRSKKSPERSTFVLTATGSEADKIVALPRRKWRGAELGRVPIFFVADYMS
ncbi:hypothetical protein MTR67_043931 [Solanum verrucosum]|uniref:Uncharacterized protein n=1 Tax=Solanum verrucosum TaxID=315347 RepID=A0AAF0USX8_SOLVR|nr:hypothetical protein MTR67_043931 [Solanum verrucosum]